MSALTKVPRGLRSRGWCGRGAAPLPRSDLRLALRARSVEPELGRPMLLTPGLLRALVRGTAHRGLLLGRGPTTTVGYAHSTPEVKSPAAAVVGETE